VLARCANLPVEMRNGEDVDGGHLVGWLPIVRDNLSDNNFSETTLADTSLMNYPLVD
jgi:hypothetical protein